MPASFIHILIHFLSVTLPLSVLLLAMLRWSLSMQQLLQELICCCLWICLATQLDEVHVLGVVLDDVLRVFQLAQ